MLPGARKACVWRCAAGVGTRLVLEMDGESFDIASVLFGRWPLPSVL